MTADEIKAREWAQKIAQSEPISETFDCIRGDLHLYETGQIDYHTLMCGLRESVAVLETREVRRSRDLDALADALEAAEQRNRELEAALAVALELLQDAGYDTDPDYRPEWKTMIDAASRAETVKPEDAQAPEGTGS